MASHVVVVDTTARTARIKTTPGKHLTEVLSEACAKFNLNPDNYTLKFNNKPVDCSRTIRLANLPQGAKLDLVQASRSPSVVNVALQLEQPGQRLTHKFPSNTSLWQILRVFETVSSNSLNLTQRGVAVTNAGGSGAGRLNYEIPVINIMGREMGTFPDLQKTLAQLGFTSSSALLRCSFRDSGKSLEDAMTEISAYFKSVEVPESTKEANGAHASDAGTSATTTEASTPALADNVAGEPSPPEPTSAMEDVVPTTQEDTAPAPAPTTEAASTPTTAPPEAPAPDTITGPDERPIVIYTPSSSTTPAAVRNTAFNPEDYVPTIDHAKSHQALLQTAGKNQRLASDAELAAAEQAKAEKLAAIEGVTIRVRLPDTSHVEARFGKQETAAALYACVRGVLAHPDQPFALKYPGPRGPLVALADGAAKRLVADLGFQGRQLVNLVWDDAASPAARTQRCLKQEWYTQGHEMEVKEPPAVAAPSAAQANAGAASAAQPAKKATSSGDKESKLKAMLNKGLFKGRK